MPAVTGMSWPVKSWPEQRNPVPASRPVPLSHPCLRSGVIATSPALAQSHSPHQHPAAHTHSQNHQCIAAVIVHGTSVGMEWRLHSRGPPQKLTPYTSHENTRRQCTGNRQHHNGDRTTGFSCDECRHGSLRTVTDRRTHLTDKAAERR